MRRYCPTAKMVSRTTTPDRPEAIAQSPEPAIEASCVFEMTGVLATVVAGACVVVCVVCAVCVGLVGCAYAVT